jgi:alpha-beta hydrolase superfamily lysophospholipase
MNLNTSIDKKYIYRYLSSNKQINGMFHISHGMAEHIGRYNWLINKLNEDGYHVIAIDHRGHGKRIEDNLKGYFADKDGWDHVVNDLVDIIEESSREFPDLKQYLIGHSMGSWIALSAVQKNIKIDGLILSGSSKVPSSLLRFQKSLLMILILIYGKKSYGKYFDEMILGSYNKFFSPNRTAKDWISSDNLNVDEYINDPMCGFVVTNGLWLDLANGMIDVFEHKKYAGTDKGLRVFLISGSKDPVGQNGKGVSSLYKFLKDIFPNTSMDIIKNARHEVFSEKNKKDNYQKLIRFISS